MFNSYRAGSNSQSISINAVTGAILKNHPKSWFIRFHLKSPLAEKLLQAGGHKAQKTEIVWDDGVYGRHSDRSVADPDKNIIVLQMVICGDMEVIAECVYEKDYFTQYPELLEVSDGK